MRKESSAAEEEAGDIEAPPLYNFSSDGAGDMLPDTTLLQQELMSMLWEMPVMVNALYTATGPCHICYEDHPTLQCRFLVDKNVPLVMRSRLQQRKLQLEMVLKQKKPPSAGIASD